MTACGTISIIIGLLALLMSFGSFIAVLPALLGSIFSCFRTGRKCKGTEPKGICQPETGQNK